MPGLSPGCSQGPLRELRRTLWSVALIFGTCTVYLRNVLARRQFTTGAVRRITEPWQFNAQTETKCFTRFFTGGYTLIIGRRRDDGYGGNCLLRGNGCLFARSNLGIDAAWWFSCI